MIGKIPYSIALIASVTIGTSVLADPITHDFSGTITNFFNVPVIGVEVGTVFTGSFTYDSNLTENIVVVDRFSKYSPATVEVQFTSPSNIQSNLSFNSAIIQIADNFADDGFFLIAGSASGLPFDFNGLAVRDLRVTLIDTSAVVYSDTSLPNEISLVDYNSTLFNINQTLDGTSVDFSSSGFINALEVVASLSLNCAGFGPPMANYPVKAKKNRAFPLKMELFDDNGFELGDSDLVAPPVVQVMFTSASGDPAIDVTGEVLSSGQGSDGNQFVYTDDGIWQFNLKSTNYTAEGKYLLTAISGDDSEYLIDPACVTSFVVQ